MVVDRLLKLDYTKVLHVAPERELVRILSERSGSYLSVDLYGEAMVRMDVTSLGLADRSQSLIWISHVLEHVERDDLAISEMYRVLKPSGVALVQVPVWRERTYEDSSIASPEERLEAFYQRDHVRLYGLDIVDRFHSVGFSSRVIRAQDFGPELLCRHGLSFASTNEVFVFTKNP